MLRSHKIWSIDRTPLQTNQRIYRKYLVSKQLIFLLFMFIFIATENWTPNRPELSLLRKKETRRPKIRKANGWIIIDSNLIRKASLLFSYALKELPMKYLCYLPWDKRKRAQKKGKIDFIFFALCSFCFPLYFLVTFRFRLMAFILSLSVTKLTFCSPFVFFQIFLDGIRSVNGTAWAWKMAKN